MQFLKTLLLFGFCLFASAANGISLSQEDPPPPQLVFLYTLYADCAKAIDVGNGPKGMRTIFPIIGGNFTGPRLSGMSNLLFENTFYVDYELIYRI